MSQENVEIVGRIWDTYVDELNDPGLTLSVYDQGLIAPDSTYTPDRQAPDAKTYVGRDGFAEFVRAWNAELPS